MKIKFKTHYKKELKRQFRLAITAAIGFLIAFSWKDTVFSIAKTYSEKITKMTGEISLSIFSSVLITLFGVLLILISSRLLRSKNS